MECAECAIILGKGVSEVASSLSLPEVFLLIKRDQTRCREQLRWDTQSRALASAAVWSKDAARMLREFDRGLTGKEKKPRQPARQDLEAGYRRLGIPVVRHQ